MQLMRTCAEVRAWVQSERGADRRIGLVPTLGALHAGHLSLVGVCRQAVDRVVLSVFVNPTQFGPGEDFSRYPRDLEGDLRLAEGVGVDVVFAPTVEEMYPFGRAQVTVDPGSLATMFEGRLRPTHFRGVATVVTKLLALIAPDVAVFGSKDAQQVVVVRQLVRDLLLPVQLLVGPTVREPDGLAFSSRNVYLSAQERAAATVLHRALAQAGDWIRSGVRDPLVVEQRLRAELAAEPLGTVDYASIVDAERLEPLQTIEGRVLLLVAVRFGATRLLDNLCLSVHGSDVQEQLP